MELKKLKFIVYSIEFGIIFAALYSSFDIILKIFLYGSLTIIEHNKLILIIELILSLLGIILFFFLMIDIWRKELAAS